jgi:hypothetical protein
MGRFEEIKAGYVAARDIPAKERKEAKDSDFIIPSNRSYPILVPADIPAAIHAFGLGKSGISFEEFKKRVKEIAHRKGPAFVAKLPKSWTEEKK